MTEVAAVRFSDCIYVAGAGSSGRGEICFRAPGQWFPLPGCHQEVGHQSGMAAVAIDPGVNHRELMVKADRTLVQWIRFVVQPESSIVKCNPHTFRYAVRLPTKIAFRLPITPRPLPNLVEHPSVQLATKHIGQQIRTTEHGASHRPDPCCIDVQTFCLIQLSTRGETWAQFQPLVICQRGLAIKASENLVRFHRDGCSFAAKSPTACPSNAIECSVAAR